MSNNNKGKFYKESIDKKPSYQKDSKNWKKRRGQKSDSSNTKDFYATTSPKTHSRYDDICGNDIAWWNKAPMYADAARVPFNRILGSPIGSVGGNSGSIGVNYTTNEFEVPGIMTIHFAPSLGSVGDANSPVNRAFTSLYGDIYSKTTGAMQFQQADLALFVTSMASIAASIACVKRALGVRTLYAGQNYYYPKILLRSLGFDPDKVIPKADRIRERLNNAVLSFNNLKLPDFLDIYKRQYSMCHNVYADELNTWSQLYVFVPDGYYLYDDVNSRLVYTNYRWDWITGADPFDILDDIDAALNAWRNSSDLGIISGSIQRAFQDNNLITLDYVSATEQIKPVLDRNILWQINNSRSQAIKGLNVTQDPVGNLIVCTPSLDSNVAFYNYDEPRSLWSLNSFDGNISDEFIMESTRLLPIFPKSGAPITEWNTETVTSYRIWSVTNGALNTTPFTSIFVGNTTNMSIVLKFLDKLSKFKYAPRVSVFEDLGTTTAFVGDVGDLYRYTTIDREALHGLNIAALQSVYLVNIPLKGSGI